MSTVSSLDLAKVDLVRTPAIPCLTVEIEGVGHIRIDGQASSLIEQIAHAYVMLSTTCRCMTSNHRLEEKVTVLAFDSARPYIKVQIAE